MEHPEHRHPWRVSLHVAVAAALLVAGGAGVMHFCNWLLSPLGVAEIGFVHGLGILLLVLLVRVVTAPHPRSIRACRAPLAPRVVQEIQASQD